MANQLQATNKIVNFLKTIAPLSSALQKTLCKLLKIQDVPRKHVFLKKGEISDRIYFIVKGLVRAYYTDESGSERTAWIMKERDAFISVRSFFTQESGDEYIETLEATTVGSISYDELEMLYKKFPGFNLHGRLLTKHYYVLADIRARLLRSTDAGMKYQIFKKKYPRLAKRVPTRHIASYFGVNEVTLYKIKNGNYNKNKKTGSDDTAKARGAKASPLSSSVNKSFIKCFSNQFIINRISNNCKMLNKELFYELSGLSRKDTHGLPSPLRMVRRNTLAACYLLHGFMYEVYFIEGATVVSWFWSDDDFVIPTSPYSTVIVGQESEIISITYTDMFKALRERADFCSMYQRIRERHNRAIAERIDDLRKLTPLQNYMKLLKQKPCVLERAKEEWIASYLRISVCELGKFKSLSSLCYKISTILKSEL